MSDFYSNMKNVQDNVSYTENGMEGYKHTKHALVDFNFKVPEYRRSNSYVEDFEKVLSEKEQYALKYLFYVRDAREGVGERELFRNCLVQLFNSKKVQFNEEETAHILALVPVYGRWDDLFALFRDGNKNLASKVTALELIEKQFKADLKVAYNNTTFTEPISLLGKWMPSENASSKVTKQYASLIRTYLELSPRSYRKALSCLRKYLDVIERKTCSNEWAEIDYNKVPSKANLKYKDAFLEHDEERRREFLSKALAGDKEVKVHMSVAFPHEIVNKYGRGYNLEYDQSLEAYWKNLKPCVGLKDTIVVRDGSGSMTCRIGNTNVSALDVSTALSIYCSQYLEGNFKDKFITFSSQAKLVDLSNCGSLKTKLERTYKENDCSNTNIQNVFELILKTAVESQMKPEELPSTVLIISDMEFDPSSDSGSYWSCGMNAGSNVFQLMSRKFKAAGYTLPKLAFWNVNSRTSTIPCVYNENGVLLISGFSQNVLNMVMNGKTDPYEALIEELNKSRYNDVPLLSYNLVTSAPAKTGKSDSFKNKELDEFLK